MRILIEIFLFQIPSSNRYAHICIAFDSYQAPEPKYTHFIHDYYYSECQTRPNETEHDSARK